MKEIRAGSEYSFTMQDIADASGVSLHTVRDHRQQGLLNIQDLADVARYIAGYRAINFAKDRPLNTNDVDIWGNPK